ncbi:MAG: hypothetical protein AB7T07_01075 [Steroidobacteraceae bacterium]
MNKADRESRLLELWLQRPQDERTMNDVLAFTGWIQQNYPHLFYGMRGDPYQNLKSVLRNHIRE